MEIVFSARARKEGIALKNVELRSFLKHCIFLQHTDLIA